MFIQTEATPNPDVVKFLPGRDVLGAGTREFSNPEAASGNPLAQALFDIGGVESVFLAGDFLTVRKSAASDWSYLRAPILASIMDHYVGGHSLDLADDDGEGAAGHDDTEYEGETAQIVAEIKDLLDSRIRPAVASDGGDITFSRFDVETGAVYLHMRGACSGCPSSSATLKAGVEATLKHYVPEVTRVEQVL